MSGLNRMRSFPFHMKHFRAAVDFMHKAPLCRGSGHKPYAPTERVFPTP